MISLSKEETASRFGVEKAIEHFPSHLTDQEEKYVKTVLQYMDIAYSPTRNTGSKSVAHFCAPSNVFSAPSTFPTAHTAEEYAESHSHVMSSLTDLHIISFQIVNVKDSWELISTGRSENLVSLRYEATGSHVGDAHNGIEPTRKSARWSGAGNFVMDEETGLIGRWWKDWDKMRMWKGLGWVRGVDGEAEFV
ncbi:hypothetical protein MMC26_004310 [Xylographa opegraphella]|nr:hypothetical protein [Xylographa opegraphella]